MSPAHQKRISNVVGNAKRRKNSMATVIGGCYTLFSQVDACMVDLSWKPGFAIRKTLADTDAAYARFANGMRRRAASKNLLAAIYCVELSDYRGLHISGLLLFEFGAQECASEICRYWADVATEGEGDFMCVSNQSAASILSKWSGMPIEGLAAGEDGGCTTQKLIEAATIHFAELSQKLCANGGGKKHRQLRVISGERLRCVTKIRASQNDRGGEL